MVYRNYSSNVVTIYNFVCPAHPVSYQLGLIYTTNVNVVGSLNLLGLASKTNAKIFQVTTSEVYDDSLQHLQMEYYFGKVNSIGIRS
jgi:UDP-glucuronate decarboxylase